MNVIRTSLLISFTAIALGCASEIIRSPASLLPPRNEDRARIEMAEEARIEHSSGYDRVLPSGSVWELRGTVPQGAVYRRVGGIFTVEGAHVHEAYIVVAGNRLVGFYLPVEQAYSPTRPTPLRLK
jgi:hypothetical protein